MSDPDQVRRQFPFGRAVLLFLMILVSAVSSGSCGAADQELPASEVAQAIRMRLESGGRPVTLRLGDQLILARNTLPDFYLARFFEPAWSTEFRLQPAAFEFLDYLRGLPEEGLDPQHYHLSILEQYLQEILPGQSDVEILADFDLLMTDAFLVLASHLRRGRVNPETIDPEWLAKRAEFDPVPVLQQGLAMRQIGQTLSQQLPVAPEYAGLRQALQKYRHIAEEGGWPKLPSDLRLRPGDIDPAVADMRRRLTLVGDSADLGDIDEPEQYDALLVEAVQRFQERHGLTPDGVIGKNTLAAMNVPATERVRQIEVNLERWRWLPRDLGKRFLLVNIAGFELVLVEGGLPVLNMRVVVGKPYRRTPVFSGLMTYLVLNPYWNVPMRIAREDLLPQIRKDPNFPARMGFKIFQGWGAEAKEISPETVDWPRISVKAFPFHLRQDPGPTNALGRFKFMLPNKYDVYLHDTPTKELFQKESRTFSSGCIRLEKPEELALRLLAGSRFGAKDLLDNALLKEKSFSVKLPNPIPVHILYWTAWVDDEHILHLRPDIYGRDRPLQEALAEGPPVLSMPADRVF